VPASHDHRERTSDDDPIAAHSALHRIVVTMATDRNPSRDELLAARDRAIPDIVAADLDILFCGINPGLWSGATGRHFANPGNRFWKTLHAAGLTNRVLAPWDTDELLAAGLGITNLVNRTTATAAELTPDELRGGAQRLEALAIEYQPRIVAVVGVSAYRTAFGRPKAVVGPQSERLANSELWVLPNPSGLNAHYQLPELAAAYRPLADAINR
jgi:TDG/mug DNA glycosylase family protein